MSEANKLKAAEAKLQKLASRLNRGWAVLHPVQEKHLQTVRDTVRQQWAEKQKAGIQSDRMKKTEKSKLQTGESGHLKSATKKKSKSKSKDHGQSH